ncbi:MAG: ABC transporter permease [Thermodesulfobacteriota bacterium]
MRWYPVFLREVLLFQKRLFRLGYVVSIIFTPLLYLVAFGLGLGRQVSVAGSANYLDFLLPGLIAVTSMMNAYTWISTNLTVSRLHFRTLQIYLQAPVSPAAIVTGQVLAGILWGLLASSLLLVLGLLFGGQVWLNPIFFAALVLNCLTFAAFGVVVGMKSRSHEDNATFSNFFILPMAFFCGTFFPLDTIPAALRHFIWILPLTHTNVLLRHPQFSLQSLVSLGILLFYGAACFLGSVWVIRNYSE